MIGSIKAQFRGFFKIAWISLAACQLCVAADRDALASSAGFSAEPRQIEVRENCSRVAFTADGAGVCQLGDRRLAVLDQDGASIAHFEIGPDRIRLLAAGRERVALIDRRGLNVFTLTGKTLYKYAELDDPRAMVWVGDSLYVLESKRLLKFNPGQNGMKPVVFDKFGFPFRKPAAFAIDSAGHLYAVKKRDDQVYARHPVTGRHFVLGLERPGHILGITIDRHDNLFVLSRGKKDQDHVHVFRGFRLLHTFDMPKGSGVAGIGATLDMDTRLAIYHRDKHRIAQYQYRQLPEKVIGLRVVGDEESVWLDWLASPEPYAMEYRVMAAREVAGPFEQVGVTTKPRFRVQQPVRRFKAFQILAVSRSGLVGPASRVEQNLFEAGYSAFLSADHAAAVEHFTAQHQHGTASKSSHIYLARSLLALGKNANAQDIARQLSAYDDVNDTKRELMARAYLQMGQPAEAREQLAGVSSVDGLTLCARVEIELARPAAARDCLARLLRKAPNHAGARLSMLELASGPKLKATREQQAKWLGERAVRDKDAELIAGIGSAYIKLGMHVSAGKWLHMAQKLGPKNLLVRETLVAHYLQRKKVSAARAVAVEMVKTSGQEAVGYYHLAAIAGRQSRPGEAVHVYRKALALSPADTRVLMGLAESYRQLKNYAQAKQALTKVLERESNHPDALMLLAEMRSLTNDRAAAIESLHRLLVNQPGNRVAHLRLARLQMDRGETWHAALHAKEADRISSAKDSLGLLAELNYRQGLLGLAAKDYKRLLSLSPRSLKTNLRLAEIYGRISSPNQERRYLLAALGADKRNEQALRQLVRNYRRAGMYSSATKTARRLVSLHPKSEYRLLLNALNAEQKQRSRNGKTGELVIREFKIKRVSTSSLVPGQQTPLASFVLVNSSGSSMENIHIKAFIAEYSGEIIEERIDSLAAGETRQVSLATGLSGSAFSSGDSQSLELVIEVQARKGKRGVFVEKHGALRVLGRNAIDWASPRSVNRFLAADGNGLPASAGMNVLDTLAKVYVGLKTAGIRLENKPTGNSVWMQQVHDTIVHRRGSVDEIGLLFARQLLAAGRRLAIVREQEGFVLLLSVGRDTGDLFKTKQATELLYQRDTERWLPLDISSWSHGLSVMWQRGLKKVGRWKGEPTMHVPPVQGTGSALAALFPVLQGWLADNEYESLLHLMMRGTVAKTDREFLSADAQWLQQNGATRLSRKYYREILNQQPRHPVAIRGIAESYERDNNREEATSFYNRLASLDLYDSSSRKKLLQLAEPEPARTEIREVREWLDRLEKSIPLRP